MSKKFVISKIVSILATSKQITNFHLLGVTTFFLIGNKITKISVTKQKISGRGGITLFLRYVEKTKFYTVIEQVFSNLKIFGGKGLQLNQFVKQMLAFFIDGTDMTISGFDKKKQDVAYAAVLENSPSEMASSHQIKRFFKKISVVPAFVFRKILKNFIYLAFAYYQ